MVDIEQLWGQLRTALTPAARWGNLSEHTLGNSAERHSVLVVEAAEYVPTLIKSTEIVFPSGLIIRGDFRFNALEISGEMTNRIQFSGTLQSSGAWTVNPGVEG